MAATADRHWTFLSNHAHVLVCLGVPILRRTNPAQPRPFKVPAPWVIGILGALSCVYVMSGLPTDTWLRLLVWLVIGFAIYFGYGRYHSVLQRGPNPRASTCASSSK